MPYKDGGARHVAVDYVPRMGGEGEVVGFYALVQDVTDRVKAAEALRASEARLRFLDELGAATGTLVDPNAVMSVTTQKLGEHLSVSICAYADMDDDEDGFAIRGDWAAPGSASIVGRYRLADFGRLAVTNLNAGKPLIVNDNLRELAPEEAATFQHIGIAATICLPLVKEGRLTALMAIHDRVPRVWTDAELSLLREVTERSWAHIERVGAMADLRNSETALRKLNADLAQQVTERTFAEEAMRQSEARLRDLNETLEARVAERTADRDRMWRLSTDLMLVARFDSTIVAVNPAWSALLGWDEAELVGQPFLEFVHLEDLEATLAEAGRLADGRTTIRFENRYRCRDGSYRHLSWTAVPGDGLIHAVARDVTAEKDAAAELAFAQIALRQSQKLDAMGQLTGGVAHDFNNLLTPIIYALDRMVTRGMGSERDQRLAGGALEAAERAKVLVQRLLAFARRQPLQVAAVDLIALVADMAGLLRSTLGPTIEVRVDLAEGLMTALADPNQLEMALLNLAVNARDAMPSGGQLHIEACNPVVRENVRTEPEASLTPGPYVRLSVRDTGTGMDEVTLQRAVEPFFSTKGIGKGTGLGLSMAHGLMAQLGGGLGIESSPGRGTVVSLWLPVSGETLSRAGEAALSVGPAQARGRVLLVDDDDLVRRSTTDMLDDLGFVVLEARSGKEALEILRRDPAVELLVTDHLMPGMSGADLAVAARELKPGLPILIVSGYADLEGIPSDLPRLTKPFRAGEMAECLAEVMGSAEGTS